MRSLKNACTFIVESMIESLPRCRYGQSRGLLFMSILVFFLLTIAVGSYAQSGRVPKRTGPPQSQSDKETLRLRAEEVLLPVSVRTDRGKLPARLERSDFIVTEDDKRQQITAVMRTPANILLLLDTSGEVITRKNINVNRELALKLVEALSDEDQAAIITYGDRVQLLEPWTHDKTALRHALSWKFKPGIKSHFHDSLLYAAEEILPKVVGRRSVVLITDGVDSFTGDVFERALAAMHRVRATLYIASHTTILIRELKPRVFNPLAWYEMIDPRVRERYQYLRRYVRELEAAEVTLRGLADETGGAIWAPNSIENFKTIGPSMIEEIGTECVISYSSEREADDTRFHPVRVYTSRPELKVRTRRGIYANVTAPHQKGAD